MKEREAGYKKSHKIYAFVVITLGLAIFVLAMFLLFYVQKIEVSGNAYTSSQDIVQEVRKDRGSVNSLYLLCKYRFADYSMPGSLESMSVSLRNPWTVKVEVKEKKILGYVEGESKYLYFDKDGTVVYEGNSLMEGVPHIEGLDVSGAALYKPLESGDTRVFEAILDAVSLAEEMELSPDRIVCESGNVNLYFAEICVDLGNTVTSEKMSQIAPILEKIEGQSGTLHLEHFLERGDTVTFEKDEEKKKASENQ